MEPAFSSPFVPDADMAGFMFTVIYGFANNNSEIQFINLPLKVKTLTLIFKSLEFLNLICTWAVGSSDGVNPKLALKFK